MNVDETIRSALSALSGKLIDAGYATQARDPALQAAVDSLLRAALPAPPAAASGGGVGGPPPAAPGFSHVDEVQLNNIVELLRFEQQAASPDEFVFSVFLGAGAHFGPPGYAPADYHAGFPSHVRPPVGSVLAEKLATQAGFAAAFPDESCKDWMRVSAWHEIVNNRGGPTGLESRVRAEVQTGKRGSQMLATVAGWPCRNYYTTNFDSHLETALLQTHPEVYVWVYLPKAGDLRQCWWRMDAAGTFAKWDKAWESIPPTGVPAQPPPEAVVVFKLHGDIRVPGSLVITEDDYIKFLRRVAKKKLPARLLLPLAKTLIFIGYSLRDFNMRYILSLLREELDDNWQLQEKSYSIDLRPDPLLRETWQNRDHIVSFIEHNLWDVIPEVDRRWRAAPP